jgi:xanthine/uracil permease
MYTTYTRCSCVRKGMLMCAGILVEGLGSLLDGMLGTGNGTTSTTINVGVIGLTKVIPPLF